MRAAILIAVMSLVTILLRFLPFLVFHGQTPPYIAYVGRVLPPAIIGMLVVYCLRDTAIAAAPHGIPELLAALCVVVLQARTRSSLVSILSGTAVYMLLVQLVF